MKSIIEEFLKMTTTEVLDRFRQLPGAEQGANFVFIPGTKNKRILLVGHADTVFSGPPGSVEWLGNIAKAGSAWSSKTNSSSSSSPSYSTKKEEPKPPEPPHKVVVNPVTNVARPATNLEMVKDFAQANGYSIYFNPELRFGKGGKSFTLEQFINANMATMKGKQISAPIHKLKLSRDDIKEYARKLGYIPFWGRGEKDGELNFCSPEPMGKPERIPFDRFVREHSKELLKLLDEKNKVNEKLEPEDYIAGVKHGVYSTKELRVIEDFINGMSNTHWRNRARQMVDDLQAQGMLTSIEAIGRAMMRWARKEYEVKKEDTPVIEVLPKAEPKKETPKVEAVKPKNGEEYKDLGLTKGFLDDDYKGVDSVDVFDIAKRLTFTSLYVYVEEKGKYVVTFLGAGGTARWSYRAFVDKFIYAIQQVRNERLNLNPPMWPFGDDKVGKKREDMVKSLARKLGYGTTFGSGTLVLDKGSEKWPLVDWILHEYQEYFTASETFEKEYVEKKAAKFSKNALKKVKKIAAKLDARIDEEKGTVTHKGIEFSLHDFRQQHDKKYAASSTEKKTISATTSIVHSTPSRAGYMHAMGGEAGWEYGSSSYSSSSAGRGLGADDRVGIAMIWMFRKSGHSILITDGEERGCVGANEAAGRIKDKLSEHLFAVEIDRMFDQEMVFYDVATTEFKEYMVKQTGGFNIGIGSFTDICPVCRAANICGVNLAAGYWNQHTASEMFSYDSWLRTYNVVRAMLYEREHPRFELPKYAPPKHIHALSTASRSGTTPSTMYSGTRASGTEEQQRVLADEALVGDDPRVLLGEEWAYNEEAEAFFPRGNSASSAIALFSASPTQDDDLTGRDLPAGPPHALVTCRCEGCVRWREAHTEVASMASLQAEGVDEVAAEIKLKAGRNTSVKGLSVPATPKQKELLEMHHMTINS